MAGLPIERLNLRTRAKLRSTQILTSLPQIVSELLQNSLDAKARRIEIGVNCEEWTCWVTDDGQGMSRDDLTLLGSSGRYGSSKAYTPDTLNMLSTFGFRGEALASAADLGCLEICSRTSRSRETWSVILKDGKMLYSGSAVRWKKTSHGTTVCVRDAFYNLPVRRLSHPAAPRTFELIRKETELYALVFPDVSFVLHSVSDSGSSKESTFRIPRTASTLSTFSHIYGGALCQHVDEINTTLGDMSVEGFISLEGAFSKAYQFLYINRHPVEHGELQRIIESRFTLSTFSKHAFEESGETSLRSSTRRSPRKAEKKPVYVLNLAIPPDKIDNLLEPAKGAVHIGEKDAVYAFLSSTVESFLVRHGFASQSRRRESIDPSFSPQKRRKLDSLNDSGYAEHTSEDPLAYDLRVKVAETAPAPLYVSGVDALDEEDERIVWTDYSTGQTFLVDRRTGNSRLQDDQLLYNNYDDDVVPVRRERRTLLPSGSTVPSGKPDTPDWIRKALEANDSYKLGEKKIVSLNISNHDDHSGHRGSSHHCYIGHQRHFFSSDSAAIQQRFTRADIKDAVVISQVDRKFVACVFGDGGPLKDGISKNGRSLVLIDQHAADERIRVELFLKELCLGFLRNKLTGQAEENAIELRHLTPPRLILLTRLEIRRLADSQEIQDALWSWGFCFAGSPQITGLDHGELVEGVDGDNSGSYAQIAVQSIPEVVADKLLLAEELRDLVKGFIAQVDSSAVDLSRARDMGSESRIKDNDWLKALRWCPRQLLDLVNSKACRGAIMFNDSLTHEQCTRLVTQLADTALPFQCAHGRPSLVPLTRFGKLTADRGRSRHSQMRWSALEQQTSPD
ncbi:mismatch repair-related protein [Moniliophthora roreri MCA 2997]|uniref:Mismatch repair-related protein n=1 Tax=Moniliophthora roreri (strain MCA 2997) TaxID=1381753 RepID=V2XR83_MONRO|nr:mismatch repair-related protein [Moniliophthora roreri MCA 2997]